MQVHNEQGRVLVVDDDQAIRVGYERMLTKAGWTVESLRDGLEAHERLSQSTFDAIVTDVHMPGYGGLEFLRRLRGHNQDVPVILVSGRPSIDAALRAIEYGVYRFLIKPVVNDVLVNTVWSAVRDKKVADLRTKVVATAALEGTDSEKPSTKPAPPAPAPMPTAQLERQFELAKEQLWVAYQPIISWSDRRVFGYEALLRTDEPSLSRPCDFIAAADHLGRLHEIGRAVRLKVAESLNQVPADAKLFVNIHARDLDDENLHDSCSRFSGIAHRVILEVTERTSLSKVEDLAERLRGLKQLGFRIAVDDTGAGHGGLTTFAHLEPEVVKLNINLVRGIDRDNKKRLIVRAMVKLCSELGILCVAEGVETVSERETLLGLGCDLMQGHLFARAGRGFPQPAW